MYNYVAIFFLIYFYICISIQLVDTMMDFSLCTEASLDVKVFRDQKRGNLAADGAYGQTHKEARCTCV